MRRPWTKREDEYLRRNLNRKSCAAICRKLDRGRFSIYFRTKKLRLKFKKKIEDRPRYNAWSKVDLKFLRDNFNALTCREIGEKLGRSKVAVAGKLFVFGLKRTPAARRRMQEASYIKPGHVPWNKNLKGYRASSATEFKKGHKPAHTKYDGAISIRRHARTGEIYKFIRVAESVWVPLQRYRWERFRGKIPPKHILKCLNGNTLDCRVSNWRLVSMARNVRENSNIEKAAMSLRQAWESGKFFENDEWVLWTLAPRDKLLRDKIKTGAPELIELKRAQHKLRREIRGNKS